MHSPEHIKAILAALSRRYPRGEKPWAERSDPFRTLISTILSAQTTDDQVDRVTPRLFRRYPTPAKLAKARAGDVARIIKSVGLHKAKSKNVIAASRALVERFDGRVPEAREKLTELAGVGRKTANVVLIKSFGVPAMPVDTHVFRVAARIGLAKARTPEKTEEKLTEIIPGAKLGAAHFWLIHHGRTLCTARNPKCPECPIRNLCEYFKKAR
ncbi:MAG TPA: endonuclease III [bacterium]|nr:endonuclease III [bacterium]